jgi:hypothetical protein
MLLTLFEDNYLITFPFQFYHGVPILSLKLLSDNVLHIKSIQLRCDNVDVVIVLHHKNLMIVFQTPISSFILRTNFFLMSFGNMICFFKINCKIHNRFGNS